MNLVVDSCVFIDTFDPRSHNHEFAVQLLTELRRRELLITMPAHAWFEVQCALRKLTAEKGFLGPVFDGRMDYPIKLIHIDQQFIERYAMVDVPRLKASDHIFVAFAIRNGHTLITSDEQMLDVSKKCGVRAFKPTEFLKQLT